MSTPLYNTDGAAVTRNLQRLLRRIGYESGVIPEIGISGVYDDTTRASVTTLQSLYGLPVTGLVDNATWDLIVSLYRLYEEEGGEVLPISPFPSERGYTVRREEEHDLVLLIQIMLNTLRLVYTELVPVPLDGRYDEPTETAIAQFQKANRLDATGEVNLRTWNALARAYNAIVRENQ